MNITVTLHGIIANLNMTILAQVTNTVSGYSTTSGY